MLRNLTNQMLVLDKMWKLMGGCPKRMTSIIGSCLNFNQLLNIRQIQNLILVLNLSLLKDCSKFNLRIADQIQICLPFDSGLLLIRPAEYAKFQPRQGYDLARQQQGSERQYAILFNTIFINKFTHNLKQRQCKYLLQLIISIGFSYFSFMMYQERQDQYLLNQYNFIIICMKTVGSVKVLPSNFHNRADVRELTNISKNLYPSFPPYVFETSRYADKAQFVQLLEEIKKFNQQLDKWKKNEHDIKNVIITYHLYENLYSRLQYILNFAHSQTEYLEAVHKTRQWFEVEKPKIRCQVREVTASMKCLAYNEHDERQINKFINSSLLNREMEPYKMMSRTAHPGIFPPKQELKYYKRKQFLPFTLQNKDNIMTAKKSTSVTVLSKNRLSKFRMSVGTMMTSTSMKQTTNNFKKISEFKTEKLLQDKNLIDGNALNEEQEKILQQNLDAFERQRKVEKQEMMQNNLIGNLNEEDEPDEENIADEQQREQKIKKLYVKDNDPSQIQYAKELAKQNNQSTLRRMMRINEQHIRSKLEDVDLKRNMMNWAKIKGKTHRQQSRKLENLLNVNKYHMLEFKKQQNPNANIGHHKMGKNEKECQIFQMQYRSKSLQQPNNIQNQTQKFKIKETFKTYSKYLNHLPAVTQNNVQESEIRTQLNPQMRSMSMTCLANFGKKKQFSEIFSTHNPHSYNQNLHEQIIRIKTSLTKKGTAIEKGTIYKALSAVPTQQLPSNTKFYTAGGSLMSNPFFPKNLGKKKKGKKAK